MTHELSTSLIDEMLDLLETERSALARGDLTSVTALFERKEKLVQELARLSDGTMPELGRIQAKMSQNQALIDGALRGIRHVSERLTALRKVKHQLDTYSKDGQRRTIEGFLVHKVEKRA